MCDMWSLSRLVTVRVQAVMQHKWFKRLYCNNSRLKRVSKKGEFIATVVASMSKESNASMDLQL